MAHRFRLSLLLTSALATIMAAASCTTPEEGTDAALADVPTVDVPGLDAPTADTSIPDDDAPSIDAPSADTGDLDAPPRLDPSCDPELVQCDSLPPICDEGEAPSVSGDCWGECIPASECRCRTIDDCPSITGYSEVCYTAGHCGPAL